MYNETEKQYFTGLSKDMLKGAQYAVLPGEPARAKKLALELDKNAIHLCNSRQHVSYLANFNKVNVLVISTGMGCPAMGITVEELAQMELKYFIRVGTSGTIQEHVNLGDIVITKAAVKLDGTSKHYAPIEYPATASFSLMESFVDGAKADNIPYHIGLTVSTDTFWPGQERYDNFKGDILRKFKGSIDEWRMLNITNLEMEASALLTISSILGLDAICFCGTIAKRTESEELSVAGIDKSETNWNVTLKNGLFIDMKKRGIID